MYVKILIITHDCNEQGRNDDQLILPSTYKSPLCDVRWLVGDEAIHNVHGDGYRLTIQLAVINDVVAPIDSIHTIVLGDDNGVSWSWMVIEVVGGCVVACLLMEHCRQGLCVVQSGLGWLGSKRHDDEMMMMKCVIRKLWELRVVSEEKWVSVCARKDKVMLKIAIVSKFKGRDG